MIFRKKLFKTTTPYLMSSVMLLLSLFAQSQENRTKESELANTEIEKMISKINTDVNSEFIYDYEKTKFVPKQGKNLPYHWPKYRKY
ncbi:MAG: hypothetical protein QNK89_01185 [Lacinutrix sp.]|uniref:hypothetical protein n=1 Tax=Lacinutrix sp. TaxID=1937692 RepID=UPI0030A029F9